MQLKSEKLLFRLVTIDDSDFIFNLRLSKGKFINNEGYTKVLNKAWISEYLKKEEKGEEYYFIIEGNNKDIGVVRIYQLNFEQKTFAWGSWILIDDCSPFSAITSAIMVYAFAFEFLDMEKSLFEVRNNNLKVKSFHTKTGAKLIKKDELDSYFCFDKNDYKILKTKYKKYTGEIKW